MSWKLNEITSPSVNASDPRATPSTPSYSSQLLNFKWGIKRDISAYPTLKDEKYYESFKRSVLVTARAHDCEEVLQPTFRPRRDADSLELFRLKNDFMYSVFNKCLLSDMGKTIVRKHLDNMNAQRVWEKFATHMTTSSKGKAEKHRLHTYVTTTVLDKSWKGTNEQFILHFNEQFRQLDEVSPPEESLPYTTRLTLLQTAVHNIPELRMVETMEEFISLSSSTPGPTMGYNNYLTLLQNPCIRYDSNLNSRPSPASRAAYQHELSHDQHDNPYPQDYPSSGTTDGGIDMPAEEFYQIHTTNLNRPPYVSTSTPRKPTSSPPPGRPTPRRSPGPIFLPANIYKLLSDVAIKELKKHNATTSSTLPPKRAVNTHDTDSSPEQPPTDTPTGDPTPQSSLQTLTWTTLNPVKTSPLMTPPLSTSWIPILPLTLSIKPTSIMCLNTLLLTMGPLLIGEPMVALLVLMGEFWKRLVELSLSLALTTMNYLDWILLPVLPSSIPTMAKWFSSCMSMPIMVEATPSTLQVKLNGFRTHVMTNPFMWEGNKLSTFLMAIPPLSNAGLVSCT